MSNTNNLHKTESVIELNMQDTLVEISKVDKAQLEWCIKQNFLMEENLKIIVLSFPLSDGLDKIKDKMESFIMCLKSINKFKYFDYLFLLDTLNNDDNDLGYVYLLTTTFFNIDHNLGYLDSPLWGDFGYTENFKAGDGMEIMMSLYGDTSISKINRISSVDFL